MLKAYEYRIYPTPQQETLFNKTLGLCRLYWNLAVDAKNNDNTSAIQGYHPTFEKLKPEALEWIKEIDSVPLSQTWSDIKGAFNNFFKSCKGQRKGRFVQPPRFKSKKNPKDGFRYSTHAQFKNGKLWLTKKLGLIDVRASCRFCEGKIKSTTIKRTATGKWFVKICVEKKDEAKCKNGKAIGIDWNIHNDEMCVLSDGTKIKSPMFLRRSEKRLARYQKKMSRRYVRGAEKQSNNYQKAREQVARLHEKVAWQRKDWLHKTSRELANSYEYVCVENVNLQVMASVLRHGKAVGDQGFGMLRSMLAYKTTLVRVPAAYTSQDCSVCGSRNSRLTLSDREWTCPVCGTHLDRDVNAATNILRRGTKIVGLGTTENLNACGGPRSSMKQESSIPSATVESSLEDSCSW
jgi:putative transposase